MPWSQSPIPPAAPERADRRGGLGFLSYQLFQGRGELMSDTLRPGVITEVAEPFTYRVRLDDGREVLVQPSRLHFGNRPEDLDRLQSLRPEAAVTVRVRSEDPSQGWLVRAAQTEEEWRSSSDPAMLLESVRGQVAERKLRLFACACCREIRHLLPEGPHRRLIEVAEAHADGLVSAAELRIATAAGDEEEKQLSGRAEEGEQDPIRGMEFGAAAKAVWATRIAAHHCDKGDLFEVALDAARSCVEAVARSARARAAAESASEALAPDTALEVVIDRAQAKAETAALAFQAELVRDLFGNPFRPVQVEPRWLTADAVELARVIHAGGTFERLSELGTVLEAAGCTEDEVLGHCRTPRSHARGCWMLDLLLGLV